MADRERETHVVHGGGGGGGGAGWLIAGILIVVLIVAGFLFYGGVFDDGDINIRAEAPTAGAPADQGGDTGGADTGAAAPQPGGSD